MRRDSAGRVRRDGQERGLRPLHPQLPDRFESRPLRAAMSAEDWERLEALLTEALESGEPTRARAAGAVLSRLMDLHEMDLDESTGRPMAPPTPPRAAEWLDWEMEKFRRLA